MIIEIVDKLFMLQLDNCPSSSSSNLFAGRDPGETVVVVIGISATVVVAIELASVGADGAAVGTDGAAVVDGLAVIVDVVPAKVDVTAAVVVGFKTQIRSDVRLPLNEMYSLLLHCFQFVQLVPVN